MPAKRAMLIKVGLSRRGFLKHSLAATTATMVAVKCPQIVSASDRASQHDTSEAATLSPPVRRTLRQKIGGLFVISFHGATLQPDVARAIHSQALGGVILYARNCGTAAQVRTLTSQLRAAAPFPLLICTDQEGGAVVRIKQGIPIFPSEAQYGSNGSSQVAYRDAATTARALHRLGLSLNLAPVVDVLNNPTSPIGSRSFGPNPHLDALLAAAAIRGYQEHGLGATAKHFIGLGHASIDSHQALPSVPLRLAELEQSDLIPFHAAVAAKVSTLLVAHVALPAIDPSGQPASLSPAVIGGLVRNHLKFRGVVMTDSLLMGALPGGQGAQAAERAFAAGADVLLFATDHDFPTGVVHDAIERLVHAVKRGTIPASRVDDSLHRIAALNRRFLART